MSRLRNALVAALAGAIVLTGCSFDGAYDLPLPGGNAVSEDDGFTITADFTDVLNVVPRSPVMVNDVPVGQVTEVERVGWHARVTLRIRDDIELPDDTRAEIRQTSLLGEKYVALEKPEGGGTGRLGDGDKIGLDETGRNPEVEEVLGALSFLLSGGGVGQLKTISEETNKIMSGRSDRIRSLVRNLDTLVGTLDDQKQNIIDAMDAIDRLAATLVSERDVLADAIDASGPAIRVLNEQHANLIRMLKSLDRLGEVGTDVMDASRADILRTLRNLDPILKGLADAGDSLPRGLTTLISFPFPKEASDIVKGDYANALFHLDFDLSDIVPTRQPTQLPTLVEDACKFVLGTVQGYARTAVANLPLTRAQKKRLEEAIVDRVMGSIDCSNPGNIGNKVVRALVYLLAQGGLGLPSIPLPTSLPGIPGAGDALDGLGGMFDAQQRSSWRTDDHTDTTARGLGDLVGGGAS